LLNAIAKDDWTKVKLGDTYLLTNYLNTIKKLDTKDFNEYIKKINFDSTESITDQLLNMLLVEFYDTQKPNLKSYFKNLHVSDKKASWFEAFVKCWVVLEKAVREFLSNEEIQSRKYMIPNFRILKEKQILTSDETNLLTELRKVRNYLLHGIETPSEDYLKNSFENLKALTEKVVAKIPDEQTKDRLKKELDSI
jgi:hypothetical protein